MDLVGKTIVEVRPMTAAELKGEGGHWGDGESAVVLVLDDGQTLFPSRDPEGNGPGALFGSDKDGSFMVGTVAVKS